MSDQSAKYTGSCLCGAIKFETDNNSLWCGHCHCPSCQKATGSAFATYVGFKRDDVRFWGQKPIKFNSSPGVYRQFCGSCGSAVSFEGESWPDEIHMMAVLFDEADNFKPTGHTYIKTRLPWVGGEGLAEHDTFPSRK